MNLNLSLFRFIELKYKTFILYSFFVGQRHYVRYGQTVRLPRKQKQVTKTIRWDEKRELPCFVSSGNSNEPSQARFLQCDLFYYYDLSPAVQSGSDGPCSTQAEPNTYYAVVLRTGHRYICLLVYVVAVAVQPWPSDRSPRTAAILST